jgi:dipeptidyl aminopeptidase/acylaminoacyl peptidase
LEKCLFVKSRDLRRQEYGDERDPKMRQFLIDISPTTKAHVINKPMLIAQGKIFNLKNYAKAKSSSLKN